MKWYKVFGSKTEALNKIDDNKAILIIIKNKRVCLSKFAGELFATDNACPHRSENLYKGNINYIGEIICPWHNYRFDLKSGRECEGRTQDLKTYPLKVEDDGVYISLGD